VPTQIATLGTAFLEGASAILGRDVTVELAGAAGKDARVAKINRAPVEHRFWIAQVGIICTEVAEVLKGNHSPEPFEAFTWFTKGKK
jgi:hypothetical protein